MGCGADIGRDARLVDADDIVPSALDEMVRDGGADDAAEPDDDDLCLFRKCCHVLFLLHIARTKLTQPRLVCASRLRSRTHISLRKRVTFTEARRTPSPLRM
ncbi:hypothetical protein RHECNPAF_12600122 [Rhizobium etli CNPAF512]|nr:hypothetical protein RHECNPAF_12600122 [Rhizobium etli CNPAF512]